MTRRADAISKTVLQVLAILLLAGIVLMILHKGYTDMGQLARDNPGDGFWKALARYVFRNLAG